jgi:hypothetical protein
MVGPPLDNWSTEDVTAIVYNFGRLIIWENDANHKGRILAKVRCAELREIPKSIRLSNGEHVDTESWTFSIEVLSQKLVVIPPDEDPIPTEGEDPHPLPNAGVPIGLLENVQNLDPAVGVDQGALPNPDENAIGNAPVQPVPNQQFGNIAFDELVNEMEADGDFQGNAQAKPNENNSALSVTNSDGEHSHNGPNIINEEVNKEQGNLNLVNPLELELLEAPLNLEGLASHCARSGASS